MVKKPLVSIAPDFRSTQMQRMSDLKLTQM